MTERLYDQDAYRKRFTATVTGCEAVADAWRVTLDRTAFFPEGGGQPADQGTLGGMRVLDVHEKDGEIWHTTDGPLPIGRTVEGELDWERRFLHMQQHTGEHIVSGIVHRLYGADNVGFHMGADAVTMDFNLPLGPEQLCEVETLANRAVWENRPVEARYPAPEELSALDYRSKKALSGPVRIVTVPGCDVCACCGTHLARTGEIGLVKLVSSMRYKGGARVFLLCGSRALEDYRAKNQSVAALSALLSAKPHEVAGAASRLLDELSAARQKISALQGRLFRAKVDAMDAAGKRVCLFEEGLTPGEVCQLCALLCEQAEEGAVFSGGDAGWRCAAGTKQGDIRPFFKEMNAALSGKGGGSAALAQGAVTAARAQIEGFFAGRGWEIRA